MEKSVGWWYVAVYWAVHHPPDAKEAALLHLVWLWKMLLVPPFTSLNISWDGVHMLSNNNVMLSRRHFLQTLWFCEPLPPPQSPGRTALMPSLPALCAVFQTAWTALSSAGALRQGSASITLNVSVNYNTFLRLQPLFSFSDFTTERAKCGFGGTRQKIKEMERRDSRKEMNRE